MSQNITRRNHYIPQFYLKNWSLDGKTIRTYSILVSNANVPYWTQQSIKNTAVWNDFYTRVVGNEELDDFEHWFDQEFERPAKPIFDKLINDEKLSKEEIKILSHFVFAQCFRTPAAYLRLTKQNLKIFPDAMNEVCGKLNKVSEHELQRSVSHQSANSKSIEDVLFPLKISCLQIKKGEGKKQKYPNCCHLTKRKAPQSGAFLFGFRSKPTFPSGWRGKALTNTALGG